MKDRNENRPGYKKTKVGWIPEEWEALQVSKGCRIKHGFAFSGHLAKIDESNAPIVVGIGNFDYKGGFRFDTTPLKRCLDSYPSEFKLLPGDILLAMTCQTPGGEILGLPGIIPDKANIYLHNQRLGLLVIRKEKEFYPFFLYYVFLSSEFNHFLYVRATGTKVKHTSPSTIESYILALPPFREQKKIAKVLSTWDIFIEQTQKLIETKKSRRKALMQQLLTGEKRLHSFSRPNRKTAYRFFDLPEDWECPQIFKIAKECSRRNSAKDDLPVLACSKHLGFVESSEYFGKRVFSEDTSNYKIIMQGEFGFPSNHIEEGSIGLLKKKAACLVSPIYTVFRCNKKVVPEYLYAVFKTNTFRHIFKASTNASVDRRGSLRWKEFSLIHVPMPSLEEQKAIVEVLKTSEDEIFHFETKLSALDKQKRGLMQKLLTGEIRVKP